jgi:hypothetical protein
MNPADIVEKVRRSGVSLALNEAGTGLSLSADNAPPREIVDLVRDARDVLVACLQCKRAIRRRVNENFTPGVPGVCMLCGELISKPVVVVACGADCGELHEACWGAWEAESDRRAREELGLA